MPGFSAPQLNYSVTTSSTSQAFFKGYLPAQWSSQEFACGCSADLHPSHTKGQILSGNARKQQVINQIKNEQMSLWNLLP